VKGRILAVLACALALPLAAAAQKTVSQGETQTVTATIEAIDQTSREVTLKTKDGQMQTIVAPPEMKRFGELKVGDTVTFSYHESIVYKVRKPGAAGAAAAGAAKIERGSGPKPSGTVSKQETVTVTIKAIDPKVPSIVVVTDDGHTIGAKVQDKKNLEGLKVGDKVEITYTEALAISVK
jgi:Cu/Ag efflux protein CusF